jgi:protocatechuate 3,4-dioxygenase alpha subunit
VTLPRTPSQTAGPYHAIGLCRRVEHELDPDGVELAGRLLDGAGDPIPDGAIELWDAAGGRWGRSGTDADGRFRFRVPRDVDHLEACVHARGLMRHQLTRIYLRDTGDAVLAGLEPERRATLVARPGEGGFALDIRMQGGAATVFFAH